jgi:hypothetical protein
MKTKIGFVDDIEIDGVDTKDYPDFCDAYITKMYVDGLEASEEQIEWFSENYPEVINDKAFNSLIE